jgi:hypothetical protein
MKKFFLVLFLCSRLFAAGTVGFFGDSILWNAVEADPENPPINSVWVRHVSPPNILGLGYNRVTFPNRQSVFIEISQLWSRVAQVEEIRFVADGTNPPSGESGPGGEGGRWTAIHYDPAVHTYKKIIRHFNSEIINWLGSPNWMRLNYDAASAGVQKITFSAPPTAGMWWASLNGTDYTEPIGWDATPEAIQSALRELTGLESVTVTGDVTAGYTVTFTGYNGNPALLTLTPTDPTSGTHASVMNGYTIFTAVAPGTPGNSLFTEIVGGGTAGSETVTVIDDYPNAGQKMIRIVAEADASTAGNVYDALIESDDALMISTFSIDPANRDYVISTVAGPNQFAGGTGGVGLAGLSSDGTDVTLGIEQITAGTATPGNENDNLTGQESGTTITKAIGPGVVNEAYYLKVKGRNGVYSTTLGFVGDQPTWTYPDVNVLSGPTTYATTFNFTFNNPITGSENWVWGSHFSLPYTGGSTFPGGTDWTDSDNVKNRLVSVFTSGCAPGCTAEASGTMPNVSVTVHNDTFYPQDASIIVYRDAGHDVTVSQSEE